MRLLVCGGVSFNDYETFAGKCDELLSNVGAVEIVSGGARGAYSLAERYAKDRNYELKVFNAEWSKYGKAAGPIRNRQMLDYISEEPGSMVVAFWDGKSRGTKNTVETAKKMRIPVIVDYY